MLSTTTTRRSVCLLRRNYDILAMPESSDRNLLVDKLQYDHLVDNPQYERLCNFSAGHYLHHHIHQLAE